jgi:hypothetical protein
LKYFTNPRAVSKRDLATKHPDLLHYYKFTLVQLVRALEKRRQADGARFDAKLAEAQAISLRSREEAQAAFNAAVGDEQELVVRLNKAARDELNEKLAAYLAELDVIEKPILAKLAGKLEDCNTMALVEQECYRDLEQPGLLREALEELRLEREAALKLSDDRRAAPRAAYNHKVREAFNHFNATVAANTQRFNAVKEVPELALKRALRECERTLQDTLLAISIERDEADSALQALARSVREERLKILEDFLQSGSQDDFKQPLREYCLRTVAQLQLGSDGQ